MRRPLPLEDPSITALFLTQGELVPSRRFRVTALLPYLHDTGIKAKELCPRTSSYPPSGIASRLRWIVSALSERARFPKKASGYDVVVLQRELVSTLSTFERFLPSPFVFDVDDAIFLRRNGWAAKSIAKSCDSVVCGNSYLADRFSTWNSNIAIIPTGVDTDALSPLKGEPETTGLTVGWIGTSANFKYIELVSRALIRTVKARPNAKMQVISDSYPSFLEPLGSQLDFHVWRPGIENELLPKMSIGIMPLSNDEWARGKCAFKMLQYMAAGVPVVASPYGVNSEIISSADVGIGAASEDEWEEAVAFLLDSQEARSRMGGIGRSVAVESFSMPVVASLWRRHLEQYV